MKDKKYLIYLHSCGLSQQDFHKMYELGEDFKLFFEELSESKLKKYIRSEKKRKYILESYAALKTWDIDAKIQQWDIDIVLYTEETYPKSLQHIANPPFLLYIKGNIPDGDMFWVVWSRKMTLYGKKALKQIVPDIAREFTIVSGWASGCDTAAHRAALESWNKTVVVLGTGIDQIYPAQNKKLFQEVVEKMGCLLSIFPLWEVGNPYNFPIRNEIVVWLSLGILVVEAEKKSWSLITARLALDAWKDVFSIPGDIFQPLSNGTNILIQKGEAKSILSALDILSEYDIEMKRKSQKKNIWKLSPREKAVYSIVSHESLDVDEISSKTHFSLAEILMSLSILELEWLVVKDISWKYILS